MTSARTYQNFTLKTLKLDAEIEIYVAFNTRYVRNWVNRFDTHLVDYKLRLQ